MKFLSRLSLVIVMAFAVVALPVSAQRVEAATPAPVATAQVTLTPIVVVSPDETGGMVTVSMYTAGGTNQAPNGEDTDPGAAEKKRGSGIVAAIVTFLLGAMVGGALVRLLMRPKKAVTPTRAATTSSRATTGATATHAVDATDADDTTPDPTPGTRLKP